MPEMALTLESVCSGLGAANDVVNFGHARGMNVVFGEGVIDRIGELCCGIAEGGKALVVTDRGIARAGHVERVRPRLESAGFDVVVFDDVHENPTTEDVDACVRVAADAGVSVIIGLRIAPWERHIAKPPTRSVFPLCFGGQPAANPVAIGPRIRP